VHTPHTPRTPRGGPVHARLLTFTGSDRVDEALAFLRDTTLPLLRAQRGFCGVSAGFDRKAATVSVLSLWSSEEALFSSDDGLRPARESAMVRSGALMQIEHFEQVSTAFAQTPAPQGALLLTRFHVAPGSVDGTLFYLERELQSSLVAQPGFCTMRTLFDRRSGRGLAGLTWDDARAMRAGEAAVRERLADAAAHGLDLDGSHLLELLLFETH
jgi:hypothetical protein